MLSDYIDNEKQCAAVLLKLLGELSQNDQLVNVFRAYLSSESNLLSLSLLYSWAERHFSLISSN